MRKLIIGSAIKKPKINKYKLIYKELKKHPYFEDSYFKFRFKLKFRNNLLLSSFNNQKPYIIILGHASNSNFYVDYTIIDFQEHPLYTEIIRFFQVEFENLKFNNYRYITFSFKDYNIKLINFFKDIFDFNTEDIISVNDFLVSDPQNCIILTKKL